MAKIGEIKRGREIGKAKVSQSYIWLACELCGKERWVQFDIGKNKGITRICRSCVWKTRRGILRGEFSSRWKGGRSKSSGGYTLIRLYPDDFFYPMTNKGEYVFEHRLVMAKHLGRCLQPWELVHHKGIRYTGIENKSDNLIDNLELSSSLGEHSLNHSKGYRDGYLKGYHDGRDKRIKELLARIQELKKE